MQHDDIIQENCTKTLQRFRSQLSTLHFKDSSLKNVFDAHLVKFLTMAILWQTIVPQRLRFRLFGRFARLPWVRYA